MDQAERDRRLAKLVDRMEVRLYKPRLGRPMKADPVILGIESLDNPKAKLSLEQKPDEVKALEAWLDKDKTAR